MVFLEKFQSKLEKFHSIHQSWWPVSLQQKGAVKFPKIEIKTIGCTVIKIPNQDDHVENFLVPYL